VLLPIGVLTYMQYRSLAELQDKTKGAFKDNVRQGLTLVENRMKQRLQDIAAEILNPVDSLQPSSPARTEELETYFARVKSSHPQIDEIFLFDESSENTTGPLAYVYSDALVKVSRAQVTPAQQRILFLFEKAFLDENFLDDKRKYLLVHDYGVDGFISFPGGTYIFYPLRNSISPSRHFAGVLLNEHFVKDDLIGGTIGPLVASHSPRFGVTISDESQHILYSNGPPQNGYILESNFDRPFSNWKAAVGLMDTNIDALARDSFLHSAGATLLVLVFLLGGIALTIRATDREARLAQAKSNFVANVSHELKTPLSLISLFSEILELGRVNNEEKKAEYYGIIRHESGRLNKTIDNILDFSRIEAGRKTYELATGDIAEVINNVLSTHRYQIINSGFDIQTDIEPDLPSVLIDRDAIAQAISNLLDNAIKYSGKVKQISITARSLGSELSIVIADHGVGIPPAEQAKVFEKFYRVGNGLVHDVKGSGLGLSLVKHIIEAHKGTISVESDVGKGTRFTILLPVAESVRQSNHQDTKALRHDL